MDIILAVQLIIFAGLMVCSAFFSSSEVSLFSLNTTQLERMQQDKRPNIELIRRMLSEPRRLIVTILIGNELVNVAASNISATVLFKLMGGEDKWWVNLFVMLPILLLLGEITPKVLAVRHNAAFASFNSPILELFAKLITPLRWIIRIVADFFITLVVGKGRKKTTIVTEDMVRSLATQGVTEGVLDANETEYINNIFDFGNQTVNDVMTPRANLFTVSLDTPFDEIMKEIRREKYSRIPVYRGTDRNAIVGILHTRDLIGRNLKQITTPEELEKILRKPFFTPPSKPAADLFRVFRERRLSVTLVVDEYGEIVGLVTMDDIMSSIFGETDKPGRENSGVEEVTAGTWKVEGGMSVDAFNEQLHANFDESVAQTMGGLVLHISGEMPTVGMEVTHHGWSFTVTAMEGLRIAELLVKGPLPHQEPQEPASDASPPDDEPAPNHSSAAPEATGGELSQ